MDEYDIRDVEDQLDALETERDALIQQRAQLLRAVVFVAYGNFHTGLKQLDKETYDLYRAVREEMEREGIV